MGLDGEMNPNASEGGQQRDFTTNEGELDRLTHARLLISGGDGRRPRAICRQRPASLHSFVYLSRPQARRQILASGVLNEEQSRTIVEAALRHAGQIGVRVSVAVVDSGGYLLYLTRMDGAPSLSPEIAEAKASGAAVMGRPGDVLADNYEKRPGFFAAASALARRPLVPGLGSVLVKNGDQILGAIGVSGGRPEQDLEIAQAGLGALDNAEA
jgi:uncharacterized protein GlcG (DUF336 family)